ncbi:MAG: DUF3341 domain-containing protein [Verrucomicrobia bacterium]|nr:DUF3341 domain-containing protein [Verrucomicrobiota bacterium]
MAQTQTPYALLAEFDTPADVMHAAEVIHGKGFTRWDVYTPFPIHGMDAAMGLGNSKVGWFAFVGGVAGYGLGMLMIWWMNAIDYPLIVGGKPMFSPFGAFPPAYELTILFGAFGAILGMMFLNRLPRWYSPLFKSARFAKVTHDKFFIVVESTDPKYSEAEIRRLLELAGSKHIELVEE